MVRVLSLLATLGCAQAFVPGTAPGAFTAARSGVARPSSSLSMSIMTDAMTTFKTEYPDFAKAGWGPSTHAERWNGRHAMFGWVVIVATAYAKGHGLIPNPEAALSIKEWGTLAILAGPQTISNERAIVLAANMHALFISICAAFAPLSFQDPLLLRKGEKDDEPAGLIVPFVPGLTKEAELLNGRLAMLGLTLTAGHCLATGTTFLEATNQWLGGNLM